MLGDTAMTNDQEEKENKLNKSRTEINRGIELLLRKRRTKPEPPKTFQIKFGKMVSFFRREIVFTPELLSGHQEKIVSGGQKDVSSNTYHQHTCFNNVLLCWRCGRMVSKGTFLQHKHCIYAPRDV